LIALVVTAVAAFLQGTVGVGYAVVAVPTLALVNSDLAPVPQILTALPLALVMLWREHSSVDFKGVGWLVAGRVPGIFLGIGLLAVASQRTLDLTIGLTVLSGVAVLAFGFHIRRTAVTQFGAGVASGASGFVAAIGGPPTALLYSSAEAATIRSTLAGVFSVGISMSIVARFVSGNATIADIRIALGLLPAVLAGWWVSIMVKDRVSRERVRLGVFVTSAAAAIGLVLKSLLS
jgi:uncharacterized membrane protein YfcA